MTRTLRRAVATDADAIHDLLVECGQALATGGFDNWSPPAPRARIVSDIAEREVYVLCDGLAVIGTVTLARDGVVNRLAVQPALQGQGIGATLTALMEKRALELGLGEIRLDALAANAALIRFYERAGYGIEYEHERDGWRFARMKKQLRDAR